MKRYAITLSVRTRRTRRRYVIDGMAGYDHGRNLEPHLVVPCPSPSEAILFVSATDDLDAYRAAAAYLGSRLITEDTP